jgi:hypothetical protein
LASVEINNRMIQALNALGRWDGPLSLDFRAQCKEDWTKNYATIIVDIAEPADDSLRDFLDLYGIQQKVIETVAKPFGPRATVLRGISAKKPANGIVVHAYPRDWHVEFEVYRVQDARSRRTARRTSP